MVRRRGGICHYLELKWICILTRVEYIFWLPAWRWLRAFWRKDLDDFIEKLIRISEGTTTRQVTSFKCTLWTSRTGRGSFLRFWRGSWLGGANNRVRDSASSFTVIWEIVVLEGLCRITFPVTRSRFVYGP